jgi:hypothetical protein
MEYPTREKIRSRCTEQSFKRGRNYYHEERILSLDVDSERITATVQGSRAYDVEVTLSEESINTRCVCPYDYAGDCKHIIAVLLAANDRDSEDGESAPSTSTDRRRDSVNIEAVVDQLPADDLRRFLLTNLEDNRELRDRLLAFTGKSIGKTVYDYKQDIDRLFDDAAGRGGMIEYNTHIDFSQYFELAETHREQGQISVATDIYRALAETIRENMPGIDDSSGYYGEKLEEATEAYAETIVECELDHEEKQPYIDYLFDACIQAEYHFASGDYDEALRTICATDADLKYWLSQLDDNVSGISLDPATLEATVSEQRSHTDRSSEQESTVENEPSTSVDASEPDDIPPRNDDTLAVSDFTDGPLNIKDFTGGVLDVKHLAVGPLKFHYFVGKAFETLRIDEPTTVEEHTVTVDPRSSSGGNADFSSSLRTRRLVSTCLYILEELGEENAVMGIYEAAYLEDSRFCKEYAERLVEQGAEQRALEVLEAGISTFRSPTSLRRLAADLYADRYPEKRRKTLEKLFLDHLDWDAYDELKTACEDSDTDWHKLYEKFEQRFSEMDRQRLIQLYIHEDDLDAVFAEITASEDLSWFRQYRNPVANVDPIEYFEAYREQLIPFAAGDTGRRHYRNIIGHLEEMQPLVSAERFEEFLAFLKETHSNRPAFLDELQQAGY